ncbi:ATP-binding protein [bacterium]|nr:ATP-binding protein [bacterium]OIO84591.1 MAG: ATPase [Anaerolineae bacterium CG2_30_58_95]PIW21048.1 MAG: ATPase [Anaerolineae bacterium CG17_big_fil_post_rev_8_21_14_2_50_57_27]PJH76240.1 MAG: ATPase [Anaerolineae bacterium CG_4_9_14_0_8_um_filter_58_9]
MTQYPRSIQPAIEQALYKGKVIVIYGARQVGKTTLIRALQEKYPANTLYLNCDEPDIRSSLSDRTSTELRRLLGSKTLILIDEAQRVKNIGLTLKLLVDNFPQIQVVATGSSSFDLSNDISEPLTGRKIEFHLYPLSVGELLTQNTPLEMQRSLEYHLRFGMYPGVVLSDDPTETLLEITRSYLYKDVLEFQSVKNPDLLRRLLQALALQVGSEVSYNELGTMLGIDKVTVARYLSLLEQGYVIFHLPPYSRNLRKELGKQRKVYFYDLGVRNALINNFNPLELRQDVGMLWENFFVSERLKAVHNQRRRPNLYFWRTYDGKEIDYLEEEGGQLTGFECKWGSEKWRVPETFTSAYPGSQIHLVNRLNVLDYL